MSKQKNMSPQKIQLQEQTTTNQKVALIAVMISAFLVGIAIILSFVPKQTTQTVTGPTVKYAIPVDSAAFKSTFSIPSTEPSSSTELNKAIEKDTDVPVDTKGKIISLSIDGTVQLKDKYSYARVVLVDSDRQEHLVYEAAYPFEEIKDLQGVCEETCLMDAITPISLRIEVSRARKFDENGKNMEDPDNPTALITISAIHFLTEGKSMKSGATKATVKKAQQDLKISSLNKKGRYWVAGETPVSKLSYEEKKKLFADGKAHFDCGFEYYKGGYFEFCERSPYASSSGSSQTAQTASTQKSPTGFSFDWRNRHGQDWMTPVKSQGGCGSCWAFSAVGTTEAAINLYFNQHINPNLAEQDLVSCSGSGDCGGGFVSAALGYIKNTGIVDETCFPYTASNQACTAKCANWQDKVWKTSGQSSFNSPNDIKQAVLQRGPLSMVDSPWSHAIVLAGFGEVTAGTYWTSGVDFYINPTDPIVGTTYWLFKNSWGTGWGDGGSGYAKMVYPPESFDGSTVFYSAEGPITPPSVQSYTPLCADQDNDTFCWWGTGPKPASCPASCAGNNAPDCDDADFTQTACPEHFICGNHPWLPSGEMNSMYGTHGVQLCCGDQLNQYPIGSTCCSTADKLIRNETVDTFVASWGSNGSADGQLYSPQKIALYNNEIYLADASNHRIQVFGLDGSFHRKWGTRGSNDGEVNAPQGIAVYNNEVFVADTSNHQVQKFTLDGGFIHRWGGPGCTNGKFNMPTSITVSDGIVYVSDTFNNRIQKFDTSGIWLDTWGKAGCAMGTGEKEFNQPQGIAVYQNEVYVADFFNNRIQVFSLDGIFKRKWGVKGSGDGQISGAQNIAIYDNLAYVIDYLNHRLQVFDTSGGYKRKWGQVGTGEGQFFCPKGLVIDNTTGKVYTTDACAHRFQVFQRTTAGVCRTLTEICGDVDKSGAVDVSDATYLVRYIFGTEDAPDPLFSADVNIDNEINVSDIVYLVSYIFGGGPAPNCSINKSTVRISSDPTQGMTLDQFKAKYPQVFTQ